VAGEPDDLQIMYGVAGERRLVEIEADWLPGFKDSRPVRIGNAAARQFQIDVFGEVPTGTAPTRGSRRYAANGAISPTRR
jgi:GH15 family glucan-1,4-alpha-glucosidase